MANVNFKLDKIRLIRDDFFNIADMDAAVALLSDNFGHPAGDGLLSRLPAHLPHEIR